MDAHMDMNGGASQCLSSMLWNWYTIDACFLASSWHIENEGMFAASCIGVILLVICLEGVRRLGKEYDRFIHRQRTSHAIRQTSDIDQPTISASSFTFRPSPIQQLIRAILHACTFGLAYIIMLLAMSYNGYLIVCIIIGAGLGKFLCDWTTTTMTLDTTDLDKDSKFHTIL